MKLKKIEIFGFKSFADKICLEFDQGITAIVGPNGCGKSNIADAFRWVLGEQSAKSMRGSKMPDVIFAGTTHRKPLNFAEVTITLSNEDGMLPVEFAEVAVTRRLHRSGESDYFINKHPVRLKDVQSLFLDSGMGKNAFSIFEQGKIDQVINFSPLERRYIFEEAAGILRFLQRKREALKKLEDSENNVSRVKDIHQEVEKQIVVLEEQAEKARLYKENKLHLEQLEKSVFVVKWDHLVKKNSDIQEKEKTQKKSIEDVNLELTTFQTRLQAAKQNLWESEKTLRARNEEVFKTRSDKEIKTRDKQSNQERLKEIAAKEKRWLNELDGMKEKRKNLQNDFQKTQKQQQQFEKELVVLEKNSRFQRDKVHALESDITKLREKQQTTQQELLKLVQSENQIESELKQNTVRLENSNERKTRLAERKEKLGIILTDVNSQLKEKKNLADELTSVIEVRKKTFIALEELLKGLSKEIEMIQEQLDVILQELAEGKARQKALLRLRDEMEGFSSGSKRLLQETAQPKSLFYQMIKGLYEHITPKAGGEAALAAVLRPYAQTLVVETRENFEQVIAFARKNQLKDFSLLCLEDLTESDKKR